MRMTMNPSCVKKKKIIVNFLKGTYIHKSKSIVWQEGWEHSIRFHRRFTSKSTCLVMGGGRNMQLTEYW